jgi:hypothetical protein
VTLREMMTKDIQYYGKFDYDWKNKNSELEIRFKTYENYLNSLNDSNFLSKYNSMTERINNLD